MKNLILSLLLLFPMSTNTLTLDFGKTPSQLHDWYAVNDGVMGGRSEGELTYTQESFIFKGYVSLENNGGFASIRSPYADYDLTPYRNIRIRFKSKGEKFALTLNPFRQYYLPNYKYKLEPNGEGWTELSIPLSDFEQHRMGEPMGAGLTSEMQGRIIRLGLIAYNKKAGPFELEVDYIAFE